ncbi:dipeptidase PepE [Neptunicella marina]|uniref:dipeptidase E n=1 Tax=Neptunicella marina TaxID=2125989 RepID=A0A8J6IJ39_9ALTE|nr:dipeptidase PepE [Neptunicella marina]MBC3764305.1 dipeptidase PepE [Neptunicella marina]
MSKLLLLSSSREKQTSYLSHAQSMIDQHLNGISEILFIPYAGVTVGWDDYTQMVQQALPDLKISGIHQHQNAKQAVQQAKAILVGGGNTFNLLYQLYKHNLLNDIRQSVTNGVPYIGWSAGSNIAGNSIRTTNDMPIIEPPSFDALNLVPFQLNPHYTEYQPPGHNGETRAQRLEEFMVLNPAMPVIAICEGSALQRIDKQLTLMGPHSGFVFKAGEKIEIIPGGDLSAYL